MLKKKSFFVSLPKFYKKEFNLNNYIMSVNNKTKELKSRMQVVLQGGGEKAIEKQKATGKLTARERIVQLLDEGSFHEYDLFIQHAGRDFGMEKKELPGDGVVTGTGTINGYPVCIYAQDFTVAGGSLGLMHAKKICKILDEKDKRLRLVSEEVTFPLTEKDKNANLICAKAADELLTISNITASFVIGDLGDKVCISGRSIGDINVQLILEKMGGGGHITLAGAQLEGFSLEDAKDELIIRINEYLMEIE